MVTDQPNEGPPDRLSASLHHLTLSSPDPERLADFYRRALGYHIVQADSGGGAWIAAAPFRHLVMLPGEARSLQCAGYAVATQGELERLRARVAAAGWPATDGPTALFVDAVSVRDPDGTLFSFGLPVHNLRAAEENRPARLQHVVMASRNPDRVVDFFVDVLGFTLSDNVVDDVGGVRTSFLRCSAEHHSFAVFKADEDRLDHHCYETRDWNLIRDWCDHMADERIAIEWGPGRHGPGNNLFMFVHDVDGNWVEISAELEIVAHDRPVGAWRHEERTLNSWGRGKLRS